MSSPLDLPPVKLVDIVFPGDTNHHGTLFGGAALAAMDRVAFISAARVAPVEFVTASCERIDFEAPAHLGDIVEFVGRVVRIGRRSLSVEIEMFAEGLLTGERRHCCRGIFHMVSVEKVDLSSFPPPPPPAEAELDTEGGLTVDLVLPSQTSHLGLLYGGDVLAAMVKSAFIAATRRCRQTVVHAGTEQVEFTQSVRAGDIIELTPRIVRVGRTSMTIDVLVTAEGPGGTDHRHCGSGRFRMVAIDDDHHPVPIRI